MNEAYKWKSRTMKAILIIIGLISILIGNGNFFSDDFFKIDVNAMVANIGALLMLVGILQWIFDEYARKELILEIVYTIKGDNEIQKNGIFRCLKNSRQINDEEVWGRADLLVVGTQYSPRFIEDRHDLIMERIKNKKETYFCCNAKNSKAVKYLIESKIGTSDINQKLTELESRVEKLNGGEHVKIFTFNHLFRYSFIYTEKNIWVRFFTNANFYCPKLPALQIKSGTPLFQFFHDDLKNMGIPV